MTCDGDIGWDDGVYGDALGGSAFADMDPPPKDPGASFISGGAASGWGRSTASTYIERPDLLTGLSGQPEQPRYR
jgi:hypothetical protein